MVTDGIRMTHTTELTAIIAQSSVLKRYMKTESRDSKFKLLRSDIAKVKVLEAGDNLEFNLYFKPLKNEVERIDIIGGSLRYYHFDSEFCFLGVKIDDPANQPVASGDNSVLEIVKTDGNTDFISDVDRDIPTNNLSNDKTFAVVIGDETYTKEIQVKYALKDAGIFKQYLQKHQARRIIIHNTLKMRHMDKWQQIKLR